ncbi:hypothetical protein MHY87_09265 [Microvirga sp. ACRRW]|uniref:thermonuclease family protein n=1 Tax=Microvirga sp. ACRRW TaxID=2918205 RepID=UPI001EF5D733|nr:hypothetical protein [Microvirga sp. ACRRW]MCG7393093.1 hypothetical protein [Microvirga sp. ACRRW]
MSDAASRHDISRSLGDTPIGNAVQMREQMRDLIHAEIEKLNPTDDARRALELIIESSLRPSRVDGELKLTVINSHGEPRVMERNGQTVPLTLQDLIAELRRDHPFLFKAHHKQEQAVETVEPAPVEKKQSRDWLDLASSTTPEPNRKLAPSLGTHALAHWRRGKVRFHGWTQNLSGKLKLPEALAESGTMAGVRNSIAESKERAQAFFDNIQDKPVSRRPGFALSVAAAFLVLLGVGAFFALRPDDTTQAGLAGPSETGALGAAEVANARPETARASSRQTLRGVPDVIDTATLSLNGEVVRLFGVEWAPGAGKPEDLTNYLQGREVTCEPTGGNDTYRCRVGEQDLSRVILFNGGGQPNAEATPELKAAADQAREAKLGVWNKQP